MRTITFEVEVNDEIIPSLAPSIYDDVFKNAPHGQLFLCKSKTLVGKKLVRLHRDAEEGGKEAPWFENIFLPDDIRIVGMSGGNAAEYVNDKSKMMAEMESKQESVGPNKVAVMEQICRIENLIGCLTQQHNESHQLLLNRFNQMHEDHNDISRYFAAAEKDIAKRIEEEGRIVATATNTVGNDILRALPELEDRIKESITHPAAISDNDVSPQALLKALEIVSRTIISSSR